MLRHIAFFLRAHKEKFMKKILLFSLIILVGIGVGLAATKLFFSNQDQQNQASQQEQQVATSGAEFTLQVMKEFLVSKDRQFLLENSSANLAQRIDNDELMYNFTTLKNLGAIQQVSTIKTDTERLAANSSSVNSLVFLILDTVFENSVATLYIELTQEDGNWKINNFNIQSPIIII